MAISPFYYIDYTGKTGSDRIIRDEFTAKLESEKDPKIKVIKLDPTILNKEKAKDLGKKVGAHMVVYGEEKVKFGDIKDIEYHILPLLCLAPLAIPSEISFLSNETGEVSGKLITHTAILVTDDPITINESLESLKENASSAIYCIGAFKNYRESNLLLAISFFKAIKNYENSSPILFYIGKCLDMLGQYESAIEDYNRSIELNPNLAEPYNNRGIAYADLGQYESAIEDYNRSIELNPNYTEAYDNRGIAYYDLGRYETAIEDFNRAIELDPNLTRAYENRELALSKLKEIRT